MSKFSERFKALRAKRKITQQELADSLKISKSSVNMYERGEREPGIETLEAIADFFNVNMNYLLGKFETPAQSDKIESNITSIEESNIYKIPVYESVSAGIGAYADDYVVDYIPTVINNPNEVAETIAIRVKGDSMYPKIEDGDIVVVHKQVSVDSGDIAVVLLDGTEGLVKKVKYGDDWIHLISLNPEYKTKEFYGADVLRIQVVGLVKQIVKTL